MPFFERTTLERMTVASLRKICKQFYIRPGNVYNSGSDKGKKRKDL